jgi:hypothetical protein
VLTGSVTEASAAARHPGRRPPSLKRPRRTGGPRPLRLTRRASPFPTDSVQSAARLAAPTVSHLPRVPCAAPGRNRPLSAPPTQPRPILGPETTSISRADPAAEAFGYPISIDIRDLVSLEDVMEEMGLGPNGWVERRAGAHASLCGCTANPWLLHSPCFVTKQSVQVTAAFA